MGAVKCSVCIVSQVNISSATTSGGELLRHFKRVTGQSTSEFASRVARDRVPSTELFCAGTLEHYRAAEMFGLGSRSYKPPLKYEDLPRLHSLTYLVTVAQTI